MKRIRDLLRLVGMAWRVWKMRGLPGGFCTDCRASFLPADPPHMCCPNCGTKSLPSVWSRQVLVAVNWHELHILGVWAENYGRTIEASGCVYGIVHPLEAQWPDFGALTLAGNVNELRAMPNVGDARLYDGEGNEIPT